MSTTNGNITPTDFDSPAQLNAVIETMQAVENVRAQERAMVDILMNGKRPYSDEEVKKHQIRINVNWNEGNNILQDANRQVNNATVYVGKYFTAKCNSGPIEMRDEWGQKFTTRINKVLKKKKSGRKHRFLRKTRNASLILHGPGPVMWMTRHGWLARYIPLEDFLIPTDTTTDLSNLQHFCVNLYLTQHELYQLTHGPNVDKGWDVKMVEQILNALRDPKSNQDYDLAQQPEKWQEMFKQNRCYYNSDAVPRVKLRMFLFQGEDGKWFRRVLLREDPGTSAKYQTAGINAKDKFVFTSKLPFADDIDEILHVAYGDCSIVPPLRHHSVRGLGTLLYGPCETSNRLKCQTIQSAFDDLMQLLRVENPDDRIRQLIVQLFPYAVLEKGVGFVKGDERHKPDPRLAEMAMSLTRQNMSENSASFVQDVNDGTNKEMTLGEAEIRANAANVMVGGMLQSLYAQDESYFEELVRRFCQKNATDPDIKKFQKECIADGIPEKWVKDADVWEVDIERVIGAGDQVLAQQRTSGLLSQSHRFDPQSQRIILRDWTAVITDNPDKAEQLVPIRPPEATDGVFEAEDVFATLMQGIPVSLREGIDQKGYTESMIGMMSGKIGQLEKQEQSGEDIELDDLVGLDTVQQDITKHIELLEQNPENKQAVKEYGDALGLLNNELKKFIQHYMEKKQADDEANQINPEAMAKANATQMLAQVKANISQGNAAMKQQQSAAKFQQQMAQSAEKHMQQLQQQGASFLQEMRGQMAQLKADLADQGIRLGADVAATQVKAKATAKASATPSTKE